MSLSEETHGPAKGGAIKTVFAAIGGLATLGAIGVAALSFLSEDAKDCGAHGYSAIVCASGAAGLVDLPALIARDRKLEDLSARAAARDGEVEALKGRLGESEARAKDLEAALASTKAASADVEKMRAEVARRDAKITELTDKLAAAKAPTAAQVPVARPTPPAAGTTPPRPPKP